MKILLHALLISLPTLAALGNGAPDSLARHLDIDTVLVTTDRPIMQRRLDRLVYDVSRDPDARHMKMSEIIEKIPTMSAANAQGMLEYGEVKVDQILIDGQRHEMINAGVQFPMRMIRGDVMARIEVIQPGSPEYDNDATIVNIITSRPLPNGVAVEVTPKWYTDNSGGGGVNIVSKAL